jgi:hypothetical protein
LAAEAAAGTPFIASQLKLIDAAKASNPDNLMAKHFSNDYFNSLSDDSLRLRLLKICKSGYENADSVSVLID